MSVPEPKENMVGCHFYSKWRAKDELSVVDLLDNQVQPGEQLLVVYLDKVGTHDRLAHCVLDDSNHLFNCTNSLILLR